MTDNEIIRCLRLCRAGDCENCKALDVCNATFSFHKETLDLIKRQKAEIERLNKDCEDVIYKLEYLLCNATGNKFSKYTYPIGDMVSYVNDYIQDCCNEAVDEAKEAVKSEAIKEFAERLKGKCYEDFQETYEMLSPYVTDDEIDNLVKEMTE